MRVHSELQQDPTEIFALLRVPLYKMGNTTVGDNSIISQWAARGRLGHPQRLMDGGVRSGVKAAWQIYSRLVADGIMTAVGISASHISSGICNSWFTQWIPSEFQGHDAIIPSRRYDLVISDERRVLSGLECFGVGITFTHCETKM